MYNPSRSHLVLAALLIAACEPVEVASVETHVEDWRDHVIYQIVVDRFDNGDPHNDVLEGIGPEPDDLSRYQGGDWAGIRRRLDYIEALGMSAIWISPPYANVQRTSREDGYHGYWPADFIDANPRFGDLAELRALVDDAHARGILVILDVVPNHAGRVFGYDLDGDGEIGEGELEPPFSAEGPYDVPLIFTHRPRLLARTAGGGREPMTLEPEHFHRRGRDDFSGPLTKELGDFPTGLRDLHTEREDVIDALVETHVHWVEQTDVDGFRIDAVPHVGREFWPRFCGALRRRLAAIGKERFLLLGEVFTSSPEVLARYTVTDALDAAFAFDLKWDLIDAVILDGGPPTGARGALEAHRALFPASPQPNGVGLDPWRARVSFGDNHDVFRLRGELDDPLAVEIALTVVFTVDAIPSVYYGTEQALGGQLHHDAREPLWRTGFSEEGATFAHIARLAAIRRASSALRRGDLTIRYLSRFGGRDEEPDAGLFAYERHTGASRALIVVNAHALQISRARFATGFSDGTLLVDALGAADGAWRIEPGRELEISLPPRSAVILEPP